MRSRIFISYRVEDSEHAVGRLADDLREHFGPDRVFHDLASIAPGSDFVDALRTALATSAATLVIIGPKWLTVTDEKGKRRLDQEGDWVAQEIASSLSDESVKVFPVLVGGADMPSPEELPESLRLLPRRQAFHLTTRHWKNDIQLLVQSLRTVPQLAEAAPASSDSVTVEVRRRTWPVVAIAVAAASVVAALMYLWQGFGDQASQEADVTAPQIPVEDTRAWTVASSSKYADTASEYRRMFLATSRDPASMVRVKRFTDRLLAGRLRYETAVSGTPVPWYMLGIVHGLETNFAFNRHLHNGDPLSARTVNVPKGRPVTGTPPFDWTTSARDVLTMTHWASEQDWSFPHLLYLAERYNGMGYRRRGVPSPYVWAGTDIYQKGKFSADGRFDAELKAQGIGVAAVLKELVARGVIDL